MSEATEQAEVQAPASIESRISNYMESGEDAPREEDGYSTEAQTEDAQDDSVNDEGDAAKQASELDQAEESTPEEEVEIKWNGESKKLKKSEALDLAEKGFDYTQKTMQLAEARRRFEADVQALQQSQQVQGALQEQIAEVRAIDRQLEAFKGVNWHDLAEQDPVQYLKINQTYRDLKEAREEKVNEVQGIGQQLQQQQSQHMQQVLAREAQELAKSLPEFSGEKRAESVAALRGYLAESGFNDAEISGVIDHRAVTMAWKAMQFDRIQKSKPADKKVQNLPKPIRPGVSPAKGQIQAEQTQQLRQQLRKTGKIPSGLLARFL